MIDLPELLRAKRKHDAVDRLNRVVAMITTNNRGVDDAEFKKFMLDLNKATGIKENEKFNREKFEELRNFMR
jgi:hypothetical protein